MVSTTSKKAYREHESKLGAQQARIVRALSESRAAASRSELAKRLRMPLSSVCGRVHELMRAGFLKPAKQRACKVTGKTVIPVQIR